MFTRVLQSPPSPSARAPVRSLDSVLEAVAKEKGEQTNVAALAAALEANGIQSVRELEQLGDSDWKDLNVTMGLKAAIKAELKERPNAVEAPESAEEMPDNLRRFLLMPGEDGKEPEPLGQFSALLFGILTTAPADRQTAVIVLCELLALVSGIFWRFRCRYVAPRPFH